MIVPVRVYSDAQITPLRVNPMRCALRPQFVIGAMASHNAFLSSPSGSARRRSHFFASSSPALPSLQDILRQACKNPPSRLGSKAAAIPEDAKTKVTDTQSHASVAQPRVALKAPSVNKTATLENEDSSICVVEMPADFVPKPRKPRQRKEAPEKRKAAPKKRADNISPIKGQPRKKLKSKTGADKKSKDASEQKDTTEVSPGRQGGDNSSAQTAGSPVPKAARKPAKAKKNVTDEPLQLEPAMTRRLDWTPPTKKDPIVIDSDSSALRDPRSSAGPCEATKSFEQLLQTYKCKDTRRQDSAAFSDEDSSFLRKRKLIELVATVNVPAAQVTEKSPTKQKAPKKRPRTITELATAAYRAPSPSESAQATVLLAKGVSRKGTNAESDKTVGQGKGKANPRKKTSKAKKKPSPPPKPVLLPPSEALKQVANQDFVFGTSSQLAVENSPTFLRDLQAAMEDSNRLDCIDLETHLNSVAIEPPEQRPKMWHAGARDADGDLFDLEVSEIAAEPSQALPPPQEDDPFGYFRGGKGSIGLSFKYTGANSSRQDDPFVDLSDGLRSPGIGPLEIIDDDFSFSDSQILTGSPVRKHIKPLAGGLPKESNGINTQPAKADDQKDTPCQVESQQQPPRPSYELYTDAQLSKEVTSYGFKAVKSRKAKIDLLEQCWQSKARLGPSSVRTIATVSTAVRKGATDEKAAQEAAAAGGKRPRGRPRKNSVSSPEAQEPPPSAQRPESPKRPRGRPRKDAATGPKARTAISKKGSASAKLPGAPSTPKPKARSSKIVIEIPDSASECGSDSSTTPRSSPEPAFSPAAGVDLSLTVNDDTNLSLDSTDEQSGVFTHITKAITCAPRTTDPANPSWHEKILLYDPILLEDLTAWLNGGKLTGVGFDGEVSTAEVKKWCESRSVCCLWKVNLRGRERKRC